MARRCPTCAVPLYLVRASPSREAATRVDARPDEQSSEAASPPSTATLSGTPSSLSDPAASLADAVGSPNRSNRATVALVLAALALTLALGSWLKAHEERSAAAASTDAAREFPAGDGSPTPVVSPSSTRPRVGAIKPAPIGRQALTVDGVAFSFRVPTPRWARFGRISINKSTVGPQGAEAIIFWTSFPDGEYADPCTNVFSPPVGPSAADLAAAVSTAPGTELVTGPSDVTVGGRAATHVVLTVGEDVGCDPGFFYTWQDVEAGALWPMTGVGDTIRVWIIEVGGTRLFIEAETTTEAGSRLEQEIQQIVGSIRFD